MVEVGRQACLGGNIAPDSVFSPAFHVGPPLSACRLPAAAQLGSTRHIAAIAAAQGSSDASSVLRRVGETA